LVWLHAPVVELQTSVVHGFMSSHCASIVHAPPPLPDELLAVAPELEPDAAAEPPVPALAPK
jgi:hypothetical protein